MINLRKFVSFVLPAPIRARINLWRERHLIPEVQSLNIIDSGVDDGGMPWIKMDNGLLFYGVPSLDWQLAFHKIYRTHFPAIKAEAFGVAYEVMSRYLLPRSLPGESVRNPSAYRPLRDPLNDFRLTNTKREELANLFRPKSGDVILDIGAFTGYGTIKLAQMVGPKGQVYAFEADPEIFAILKRNIEANNIQNVQLFHKGAADQAGELTFYRHKESGTINSLDKDTLTKLGHDNILRVSLSRELIVP
ncbi:MAG: FkbM family methyltransferase, partial [Alphaproteobacteria bacterium]